jgi:ABC-type protease/lipase transport system fused ATPase/permease subunit
MIMTLPQGYDTEIGEAGVRLSGGQRQRIALARALFGDPRLVVLDEPDAGLDHEGELALVAALAALKEKGTTIVLVSHRPSILSHADKLAVMRRGVVELFGPREEVLGRLRPTLVQSPRQVAARVATSA